MRLKQQTRLELLNNVGTSLLGEYSGTITRSMMLVSLNWFSHKWLVTLRNREYWEKEHFKTLCIENYNGIYVIFNVFHHLMMVTKRLKVFWRKRDKKERLWSYSPQKWFYDDGTRTWFDRRFQAISRWFCSRDILLFYITCIAGLIFTVGYTGVKFHI